MIENNFYPLNFSVKQYENMALMYGNLQEGYAHFNNNAEIAMMFPVYLTSDKDYPKEYLYSVVEKGNVTREHIISGGGSDNHVDIRPHYERMLNDGAAGICLWHNHRQSTTFTEEDIRTLFSCEYLTAIVADSGNQLIFLQKTQKTFDTIKNTYLRATAYSGTYQCTHDAVIDFIAKTMDECEAESVKRMTETLENRGFIERYKAANSNDDTQYAYDRWSEYIRRSTFINFCEKTGTEYFTIDKHHNNIFLFDVVNPV